MRIEVTHNAVDIWASKEGVTNLAVTAASVLLMLAIVGFVVTALITAVAIMLVLPVAWWQRRTPDVRARADARPTTATVGLPSH